MPETIEVGIAIMFIVKMIRAWTPRVTFSGDRVLVLVFLAALLWAALDGNSEVASIKDAEFTPDMLRAAVSAAATAIGANVVLGRVDRRQSPS